MVLLNALLGGVGKKVHTFLKSISLKVNVIALPEFEPAYYDATVQHLSH